MADKVMQELIQNKLDEQRNQMRKTMAAAYFNGDMSLLEKDFDSPTDLFEFVKEGWEGMPATITCKVITRRSQFPKWEDCPKDRLYFGIVRRKRGDKVIVVKHQSETTLDCRVPAESLTREDLVLSVWPTTKTNICKMCGDFYTRIDSPGLCVGCRNKLDQKNKKNVL